MKIIQTILMIFLLFLCTTQFFGSATVVTNCNLCPRKCTPLADNSNAGMCCGMFFNSTNTTNTNTTNYNYCDPYCVTSGLFCCGCNYISPQYSCVSCPSGELCQTNGQSPIIYYCTSGIERLVPSIVLLGIFFFLSVFVFPK